MSMGTGAGWSGMVQGASPPTTRSEPGAPAPAGVDCGPGCPEASRGARWHAVAVDTTELDGSHVRRKVEGDDSWVAAALRALADRLDPPPPVVKPSLHR